MGCCYGFNPRTGRTSLACDGCGTVGGVRRRTCPRKVLTDSLRSLDGARHEIAYCSAPAYCDTCWVQRGRTQGVHANCAEGAALRQAAADLIESMLDEGHYLVVSAAGSWDSETPDGYTKVTFRGRDSKITALVPADQYDATNRPRLSDYPDATVLHVDPTGGCGRARRTPPESRHLAKSLPHGTLIRFDDPVQFMDGVTEDTFVVAGQSLRRYSDRLPVRFRNWQSSHAWVVVTADAETAA